MNVQVIDNFLKEEEIQAIVDKTIYDWHFPLYYNNAKIDPKKCSVGDHDYQFIHIFYMDECASSKNIEIIQPVLDRLNFGSLVKVKLNLQLKYSSIEEFNLHNDLGKDYRNAKTAVFYLNDNNGYTRFESGEKIISKRNRMVIFDQSLKHTGSTCTDAKFRAVLNINFYEK